MFELGVGVSAPRRFDSRRRRHFSYSNAVGFIVINPLLLLVFDDTFIITGYVLNGQAWIRRRTA